MAMSMQVQAVATAPSMRALSASGVMQWAVNSGSWLTAGCVLAWPFGSTILDVTRERWAQIGITVQFLIVVRTLGEIFRLRHVEGAAFSAAAAMPYVGGALIAAGCCWAGVILYFFRRYALAAWLALATVAGLLIYKVGVIGR